MKIFTLVMLLCLPLVASSQNLSPEEQRQMLEDMKVMKEKIQKLENKPKSGLKTINYENETAETKEKAPGAPGVQGPSLTPEQTKKLMEDINTLKLRQSEAQKMLDEMDKEE